MPKKIVETFEPEEIADGPTASFCQLLETAYNTLVEYINTILLLPDAAARKIKSFIRWVETTILGKLNDAISFLERKLAEFESWLKQLKIGKLLERACIDMWRCPKLRVLAADNILFGNKTEEQLKDYNIWKNNVCGGNLLNLLKIQWSDYKATFFKTINEILAEYNSSINEFLDGKLQEYQNIINNSGLPNALQELDEYAQCLLAGCDFASSIFNAKENLNNRLYLSLVLSRPRIVTFPSNNPNDFDSSDPDPSPVIEINWDEFKPDKSKFTASLEKSKKLADTKIAEMEKRINEIDNAYQTDKLGLMKVS
jgi:hypothetical protein